MRKIPFLFMALMLFAACQKKPDFTLKVLIGGTTIIAAGAEPIEDSVVIVSGTKIRAVGARKNIPIPQASDRTDLAGEWIVPADGSRVAVDETANLIILKHAPNGITPASPADVGARLVAGEWKLPGAR